MKTVLVGLDPANHPYEEALSPTRRSGAKLSSLCKMTHEEFLNSFTRLNLHCCPEKPQNDLSAANNLIPLLQGRRVVFLGQRVARAFCLPNEPMFSWQIHRGFVATVTPHPSGRSRWWNDPKNQKKAASFFEHLTLPCVHVEGQDGSGKTTLLRVLSGKHGRMKVIPTDDPPKSWRECLNRIDRRIPAGLLCDRSSGLVSELVYGPVLRGGCIIDEGSIWGIVRSIVYAVQFVYCRPPWAEVRPKFRQGEEQSLMEGVIHKGIDLRFRYDEVMGQISRMGGSVVRYDWTVDEIPAIT